MERKRNRLEIIHDILEVISSKNGKIKPTHILYKANLSHVMMAEILQDLKQKNFIEEKVEGKNKTYSITNKGREYLNQYALIEDFNNFFGLGQ